jgi:hypothetical protein
MKLRIVLYCLLGGLPIGIAALGAGHFAWWWLSGIVLAAAFVPVALLGPRSALGQFGVMVPVFAFVTVLCTWSEAMVFVPEFRKQAVLNLMAPLVMYLIMAAVLAALTWGLKLTKPSDGAVQHRSPAMAIPLIFVSGVAYLVYYFIFGIITYQFFTKQYLPGAQQIAQNLGLWFYAIQVGRGILMTLAVVPAIYTLRLSRWQTAIAIGVLIWVAGGLAPLLVPNAMMGATQRMMHIVEILTQNASLGITAALLLRPKATVRAASSPQAPELLRHAS